MDQTTQPIADAILRDLKSQVGDLWDKRLTAAERDLVSRVANDAARLQIAAMAAHGDEAAAIKLQQERRHIEAQLANLTCAEAVRVQSGFWAAVGNVLTSALKLALRAI